MGQVDGIIEPADVEQQPSEPDKAERGIGMIAQEGAKPRLALPPAPVVGIEHDQRQLRVGELVRHAISDILAQGNVHDADLEGHIITVPEVRMSPDLKLATIYVMPLGGRDTEIILAALDRNKKYLRGEIAHRVNLKFAPELRFRADERFDEAERIEKLLRTPAVQKDLAANSPDSEE